MQAIGRHRSPTELQRHHDHQKNQQKATHSVILTTKKVRLSSPGCFLEAQPRKTQQEKGKQDAHLNMKKLQYQDLRAAKPGGAVACIVRTALRSIAAKVRLVINDLFANYVVSFSKLFRSQTRTLARLLATHRKSDSWPISPFTQDGYAARAWRWSPSPPGPAGCRKCPNLARCGSAHAAPAIAA